MNTKFVVALFVGAVSAKQLPNINMLTVQTSDNGAKQLEAQAKKVEHAWDSAASTQEAENVYRARNNWMNTQETQEFFGLLDNASHSAEAQRLDAHGQALNNNIQGFQNGAHIDNSVLEARLHAIEAELDHIEQDTKFPQQAEGAWNNATTTKQAKTLGKSLDSWGNTNEAKQLHHQLEKTGQALEQYVQVSDLPASWQNQIQRRAELNMIDITVAPAGQQAITKEYQDVDGVSKTIEQDSSFQAFAKSGEAWSQSAEVQTSVQQLDAWSKTEQAKKLEAAGKGLESELKSAVQEIPNGVRVANSKLPALDAKAKDLERRVNALKPTAEMKAAFESSSWRNVEAKGQAFANSAKGKQLKKELDDLLQSIQTHVQVTDVPH